MFVATAALTQGQQAVAATSTTFVSGFEGGIPSIVGTHGSGATFRLESDSARAHSGNNFLEIVSTNHAAARRAGSELTRFMTGLEAFPVVPGDEVEASVFLRAENVVDDARMVMVFFAEPVNNNWSAAYLKTFTARPTLRGDTGWREVEVSQVAPANAAYVRIEFRLYDTGTLLIDDFALRIGELVPPPTTTTTTSPPTTTTTTSTTTTSTPPTTTTTVPPTTTTTTPLDPAQIELYVPGEFDETALTASRSDEISVIWNGFTDNRGQNLFTLFCDTSQFAADDPIIAPGVPGGSHLHEFIGLPGIDAFSTTQSMIDTPGTNCTVDEDRSAYWAPAAFQDGVQLQTQFNKFYYRVGKVDPATIVDMPIGLKIIAGNGGATEPQARSVAYAFTSSSEGQRTEPKTQQSGTSLDLFEVGPDDNGIRLNINFPQCWDGVHLWLAGTAHMAYPVNVGRQYRECPPTHPVPIININYNLGYPDATGGPGFVLASGEWYTMHADFVNGWDPETLRKLTDACPRAGRYCDVPRTHETCPAVENILNHNTPFVEEQHCFIIERDSDILNFFS
ncbi:MAG: DUF1996 domain-containing protein [Actinobacteria bacterium]|nr:DUF1996 domain-containing protein [Actinomycetota bacterium]